MGMSSEKERQFNREKAEFNNCLTVCKRQGPTLRVLVYFLIRDFRANEDD
jgi:hypothetical protein